MKSIYISLGVIVALCYLAPVIDARRGITVTLGRETYLFSNGDKFTWSEARDYCRTIGMRLLIIETEQENNLIADYLETTAPYGGYWMGGYGDTWADTGRRMRYTNFADKTSFGQIKWRRQPESQKSNLICEETD